MTKKRKMEVKAELLEKYYVKTLAYLERVIKSCNTFSQLDSAHMWALRLISQWSNFEERKYAGNYYISGYLNALFQSMRQRCSATVIEILHKDGFGHLD